MASVIAKPVDTHPSRRGKYVPSPTAYPTWSSPHCDYLETEKTFAGYTTKWTTHETTHLSISDTQPPQAVCIAHFGSFDSFVKISSSPRSASLVTASYRFITIASPATDVLRTPLGDPLTDPLFATHLFTPPFGLIFRTSQPPHYHYLPQPLQDPIPLDLPPDHTLLHAFPDLPILVTRANSVLTVWSCQPIEYPIPQLTPDAPHQSLITVTNLKLIQLHNVPVHPSHPISAFLSHDVHGLLVLCIVSDSVLTGLSIVQNGPSAFHISPSFRIRDVASAVPVLAIRRPHACLDALVRHADGTMSLFMGRNRLCAVRFSDCSPSLLVPGLSLAQPVLDEFSLLDTQGTNMRFSLAHACFVSPLVNDCLAAMTFGFEEAGAVTRITALYNDLLSARSATYSSSVLSPSQNYEWSLLEGVLLHIASSSSPVNADAFSNVMDIDSLDTESDNETENGSDSDWNALLSSDYHENHSSSNTLSPVPRPPEKVLPDAFASSCSDPSLPHIDIPKQILRSLHLLYEDRKLRTLCGLVCRDLARLNHRLAYVLGAFEYIDHYRRDFPDLVVLNASNPYCISAASSSNVVPSIIDYLAGKIRDNASKGAFYPAKSGNRRLESDQDLQVVAVWRKESPFELTQRIISYYDILFGEESIETKPGSRYERLLLAMVHDNVTTFEIDELTFGVALPLRDALWNCRQQPNPAWPYGAFALTGREDLFNFADFDRDRANVVHDNGLRLVHESRALLQIHAAAASTEDFTENTDEHDEKSNILEEDAKPFVQVEGDGCDLDAAIYRLRFSEDKRIEEARRILRSTDFIIMTPVQKSTHNDSPEFDVVFEQKRKLEDLLQKRFAAPIGRGAFTLRTFVLSDPTRPLPVPKICMTGKIFGQNGAKVNCTNLDPLVLQWAEFHNGVAAALRIIAADANKEGETGQILTRSWIVNHRPSDASGSPTHAGMLLGFGLGGYLPVLRKTDYIQYLVPRHELTAIGLMLGLSAGNIGSMDEKITKMLCLHIRPFNEAGFSVPDFFVTVNVQTAAVLGLGLVHMGSCDHVLLEGLFSVLNHRPKPGDAIANREGLALASGFAIGLICLGHGSSSFDAADRRQIDRLVLYANGGSIDDLSIPNGHHNFGPRKIGIAANQDRCASGNAESETSRVLEGSFVNADVVSPGALIALTLIYLKTNDKRLSDRITIPDSSYSLGRVRPDHVYLRLITRSLIMWDQIDASLDWVQQSIPDFLLPVNETGDLFDLHGCVNVRDLYSERDVDIGGILQTRAFAVAGACTAIALKYAGTSDRAAIKLLMKECEAFECALVELESDEAMDYVFSTGLRCAALGLGVVAAGSGDLEVFRLLRRLRKRGTHVPDSGRYASHVSMHMAIGFLFLGGGCQTFGTSNLALVSLLCAIYPPFPDDLEDNQYHLQAFRHLYVLATEPRCVETRDVNTGMWCCVDIELAMKDGQVLKKQAPCIVPEAGLIEEIRVVDDRYLKTRATINRAVPGRGWYTSSRGQVFFVKRKTGHLPFSVDPKGCKGILVRCLNRPKPGSGDSGDNAYFVQVEHLVKAFSADPEILAFVKYFCSVSDKSEGGAGQLQLQSKMTGEKAKQYVEMLYECLSNDKADAVKVYLDMELAAEGIARSDAYPSMIDSLVLSEAYMLSERIYEKRLVRTGFTAGLLRRVREEIVSVDTKQALLEYVTSCGHQWPNGNGQTGMLEDQCDNTETKIKTVREDLSVILRLNGFPPVRDMTELSEWVKNIRNKKLVNSGRGDVVEEIWSTVDGRLSRVSDRAIETLLDALIT